MNTSRSEAGLTLVDLLIIVAILGILGMLAVPAFRSTTQEARLTSATSELVDALECGVSLAARYQRPFGISIPAGMNSFSVYDWMYRYDNQRHTTYDPPIERYGLVMNPTDKKWYTRDFDTMKEYAGVKIPVVPQSAGIIFYPDGHSSSMSNMVNIVLALGADRRTVTVNGVTCRIYVQ